MYRELLFLSILLLFSLGLKAQDSKVGGLTEGWNNYNNSTTDGLGPRIIDYNYIGMRSIDSVPPIGVHPRVYFGPNEIDEIRSRLNTSNSGQEVRDQIRAYTTLAHLGYYQQARIPLFSKMIMVERISNYLMIVAL